jgi:hypothetical protein
MVQIEKHEVQPEILKVKVVSAYKTQSGTLVTATKSSIL